MASSPTQNLSHERIFEDYKSLYQTLKFWWSYSDRSSYSKDMWRSLSKNSEGIFNSDLNMMPFSSSPYNLTNTEFNKFIGTVSSLDYKRVNTINPRMLSSENIVQIGGSCAIETGLVILINLESKSDQKIKSILRAADLAPTFTHISGATLGGTDFSVHLLESDLWIKQLEIWGVESEIATFKIKEAFDRISRAVQRRSELINPNSIIYNIDYSDLKVEENTYLWAKKFNIEYKDDARLLQVLYTYLGDTLNESIFNAINEKHIKTSKPIEKIIDLDKNFIPMRIKQVDHLNASSLLEIPLTEIVKKINDPIAIPERIRNKKPDIYRYTSIVKMLRWNYFENVHSNYHNLLTGFIDIPFGDKPAHQKTDWKPQEKHSTRLEDSISSIYRLNNTNFDSHFNLLNDMVGKKSNYDKDIFPLKTNIFLSHAFNFLWDDDFIKFLGKLKTIESNKRTYGSLNPKNRSIYIGEFKEIARLILPKLVQYYSWIYSLSDEYPSLVSKSLLN